VLERVPEVDGAIAEAARAREANVIGAQHFQHFRADEALDERHLEQAERDRGQDERLQARGGEKAGRPPAKAHRVTAAEGGQPAELDRKDEDKQDADQERGQRYADERDRKQHVREPRSARERGIYAHENAGGEGEEGGDERELERRRQALLDERRDRLHLAQAQAELALHGVAEKRRVLHID